MMNRATTSVSRKLQGEYQSLVQRPAAHLRAVWRGNCRDLVLPEPPACRALGVAARDSGVRRRQLVEWAMHRFVMHRRIDVFALRAIYERHTREHHQYFTDADPTIDTTREFRIVFFPWRVLITLGVGGTILGSIAARLFDANAGYIVFLTMVGQYLVYETFPLLLPRP